MSDLASDSSITWISERVSAHSSNWPSKQAIHRDVMDQVFDPLGSRIAQRAARAFDGVGKHQHAGLARLRLGAGIAEGRLLDARLVVGLAIGQARRLAIEVFDQRRPVMLFDEVDQRPRQIVLHCQVNAVFDVANDNQRAHRRGKMLVAAFACLLSRSR